MRLPLHLVPEEVVWLAPDGEEVIAITKLDMQTRMILALDMALSKQSFETTANRALSQRFEKSQEEGI